MYPENKDNIDNLKQVIGLIRSDSCPYDINLHTHTICSDGSLSPSELIFQATNHNLKHLSVTDHHSIKAYSEMYTWLNVHRNYYNELPHLWSGIEISCILKKCLVHVLGLGFDLSHQSLHPYITGQSVIGKHLSAEYVVEAIHNAGGLVILAHPARYRIHFDQLIIEAAKLNFDGVETWYDYDFNNYWQISDFICRSIYRKTKELKLLSTCGTDTHGNSLLCR